MTPDTLKTLSLYEPLEALFHSARDSASYSLNALPEEEFANFLVERLATVLVEGEDLIERLCTRKAQAHAIRLSHRGK